MKKTFLAILALLPLGVSAGGWGEGRGLIGQFGLPAATIVQIVTALLTWLLIIVGMVALIAFFITGIMYLTAAGDDHQIERAKTGMKASIIGVIVALAGYVILQAVFQLLSGSSVF